MADPIESHVDLAALPKEERLSRMRHSAAHVLAEAMVELMPEAELGIGPPIDTGFYYDFRLPRPLNADDLVWLEERMRRSIAGKHAFRMSALTKAEAEAKWAAQPFKLDLLKDLEEGNVTQCTHAAFTDLCRGGHVNDTGEIPAVKLMSIAGAYWRGSEKNPRLQRVYGALFESQGELDAYEQQLEEARRRDHRRIGRDLKLFDLIENIGPGHVIWLPAGATIRRELMRWIEDLEIERGYQHIVTPNVGKKELYVRSGHWSHYQEAMYPIMEREGEIYALRPMNCPSHIMVYESELHSYRELPIRLAELGNMHRWEKSGQLTGMSRVRIMTLNDSHIFCTGPEQVEQEIAGVLELMEEVYGTLGLRNYSYRLSLGDPDDKEKYVDNPPMWEMGEALLRRVMQQSGLEFYEAKGEAAFYGPKIDFIVKDCIGREWQLGTVQLDYNLPKRFELEYTGSDNAAHRPVMLHRAPFGSMERFCGILIEHFAGAFPLWLAPEQVRVLTISEKSLEYGQKVEAELKAAGFRVTGDYRSEKIGGKVAVGSQEKVPYLLVVGEKDAANGTVSVRDESIEDQKKRDLGPKPLAEVIAMFREEIATKRIRSVSTATADLTGGGTKFAG